VRTRVRGVLLSISLVSAATVLDLSPARADDPLPSEQSKPQTTPYLLSGDRFLEVNVGPTLQLDWNGLEGSSGPTAHAGLVLGGEVGVPSWEQRFRPSLFSGVKLGDWAADSFGPFAFVEGARLRVSPFMWDIFDIYAVLRGDFDLQINRSAIFRPGVGFGVRAARLLAVELTWDITVPLGSDFQGTRNPKLIPTGISFGVLFDACFNCNRSTPSPTGRNLACRLYNAAADSSAVKADICKAVPAALSAIPSPLVASRLDDGTRAFLSELGHNVTTDAARKKVESLATLHAKLLTDWSSFEQRAAIAAQHDRQLTEDWTYAPVPAELRSYFGCDIDATTGKPLAPPPACSETSQ
jgi:hypothetical protein